jgi:hypothetical protein
MTITREAKAEYQIHVVLDEQDGDVAGQAGDGGEQFRGFLRAARRPPARRATTPSAWWQAPARFRARRCWP